MAHGKVITAVVRLGREAEGNLRKTGVYHDGRDVSLGQGRLFEAGIAGAKLIRSGSVRFSSGPVRSVKRDNAENQRARIAPGLDRHGIGWWGLAGRIGCQRAGGPFGDAERAVIDGGSCVSAMRQRVALGVRCVSGQPRAVGACSGKRGPSERWRLAMPGAAGWLDWRVDGSKSSFRAKRSADPETVPL